MPKPTIRRRQQERGAAIVEFSLVLLPLFALLLMTLDLAWLIFGWASLQEGVREGVRFAITSQTDDNIRVTVKRYSFGFVQDATLTGPIQISYYLAANPAKSGTNCSGSIVKIAVSGIMITPMAPLWRSNSPIAIGATSADVMESSPVCSPR